VSVPLRRLPAAAMAIGLSTLRSTTTRRSRAPSSSIAVASKSPAQPSGFVPGWDWGGAAVTKQAAGEFSRPDRVCKAICRLQDEKVRGLVVFSYFLGGLLVKLYPPLELISRSFWTVSVKKKNHNPL
jgi:hypothetical protein